MKNDGSTIAANIMLGISGNVIASAIHSLWQAWPTRIGPNTLWELAISGIILLLSAIWLVVVYTSRRRSAKPARRLNPPRFLGILLLGVIIGFAPARYLAYANPPLPIDGEPVSIRLTVTPRIRPGDRFGTAPLEGKVTGLSDPSRYRAVIYATGGGIYFVQPTTANRFTQIAQDGSFHADVRGTETKYYVLIVKYDADTQQPPAQTTTLAGVTGVVAQSSADSGIGQK